LVIADAYNHCIRKLIVSQNKVVTIAGTTQKGKLDSRFPLEATFYNPWDLEIDKFNGDIYIADTGNYLIRKITSNGVETLNLTGGELVIAGINPQPSFISLDMHGNLIISENRQSSINVILNIGSKFSKSKITVDFQEIIIADILSLHKDKIAITIASSTIRLHKSICSARCPTIRYLMDNSSLEGDFSKLKV